MGTPLQLAKCKIGTFDFKGAGQLKYLVVNILFKNHTKVVDLLCTSSSFQCRTNEGLFLNILQTQILIHVWSITPMNAHTPPISMSTSERLSRFDLEIHKINHHIINGMFPPTKKIISHKCNKYGSLARTQQLYSNERNTSGKPYLHTMDFGRRSIWGCREVTLASCLLDAASSGCSLQAAALPSSDLCRG
jgi:hypothetical protein